jgi:hypothetical protein
MLRGVLPCVLLGCERAASLLRAWLQLTGCPCFFFFFLPALTSRNRTCRALPAPW